VRRATGRGLTRAAVNRQFGMPIAQLVFGSRPHPTGGSDFVEVLVGPHQVRLDGRPLT
jgi:hypothetical protein